MPKEIKRINVRMGQVLHDWFEEKADELGVPTSALMIIAMNEYRKMQTASEQMPFISNMLRAEMNADLANVQSSASGALLDMERSNVIA